MQHIKTEQEILQAFLASLLKLQNVERGSIWVKEGDDFLCIEALGDQHEQVKGISIAADTPSIVGWVIENGRRTIARPREDTRHFDTLENDLKVKSSLILCFPLIMQDGTVYGAIELIDTSAAGKKINLKQEHLDLIENLIGIGSIALSNFIGYRRQLQENRELQKEIDQLRFENPLIGNSAVFLRTVEKARDYAKVDFPVLITGESGTGKEMLAREIFRLSPRSSKPFLVQNCSAIPETLLESELFGHTKGAFTGAVQDKTGLFEAAEGGTVFLDEIGDMPLNLQARILRVLQDGEVKPVGGNQTRTVNVRIISATNADLEQAIRKRTFREDLFYRLHVLPLHMPPLRSRREDIPGLLNYFLQRECHRLGISVKRISPQALRHLEQHAWNGNVRELENVVKLMIVATENTEIDTSHLPEQLLTGGMQLRETRPEDHPLPAPGDSTQEQMEISLTGYTWQDLEKKYVTALLEKNRWSITKAAACAGLNRSTFNSRMRRLGIRK